MQPSLHHSKMKYMTVSDINLSATKLLQVPGGIHWPCQQHNCERRDAVDVHYLPKLTLKSLLLSPSPCHHSCTWLISCCEFCLLCVPSLWHPVPFPVSSKSSFGEKNSLWVDKFALHQDEHYSFFLSLAGSSCWKIRSWLEKSKGKADSSSTA